VTLTKERAKKPILDDASGNAATGYDSDKREATFTLSCHGPWVQGKGHECSYTIHLTRGEMLHTVAEWMNAFRSQEAEKERRALASLKAPA